MPPTVPVLADLVTTHPAVVRLPPPKKPVIQIFHVAVVGDSPRSPFSARTTAGSNEANVLRGF